MSGTSKDPESGTRSIFVSPNTNYYLPPEIWAKIFHYLSAEDVISVTHVCPEWKDLLESERKYALLEQVLPLLNMHWSNILKCREVSKGAKKAVNHCLETYATNRHNYSFEHEESESRRHFNIVTDIIDFLCYNFSALLRRPDRSVQDFLTHTGENRDPGKNPFVTRSLSVPLHFENDDDYTPVDRMLARFGHHVWALTLLAEIQILDEADEEVERGEEEQETITASSRKLPRLLSLVPNLKSLDVSSLDLIPRRLVVVGDIGPDQLPELPNLETLSFEHWFREASLPFTILRRYGPQITTLIDTCFHSLLQLDDLTVAALNELLPNLKKLKVRLAFGSTLTKLANVNWKLDELTIGFLRGGTIKVDLFNIVNNFRQTLVQLQVTDKANYRSAVSELVKDNVSVELSPPPIEALSHLKILCLNSCFTQLDEYDWFWKFVPNIMSNLEEIQFHPCPWHVDEGRTIDIMMANEIFQKIPNIQKIWHWARRNGGGLELLLHVFARN
ncbi:unnamed protein product [Orchesella dallaii]|uniref:F-box domain-containing protein n=1 Tax=Orchesella dallaii TaxID=48710 RepID=A0ABP1QUC3_9HEXA